MTDPYTPTDEADLEEGDASTSITDETGTEGDGPTELPTDDEDTEGEDEADDEADPTGTPG
jgi:hypothetical protein